MSEYCLPDSLVLKFEEYDYDKKDIDNCIYILYDIKEYKYIVRGQRNLSPKSKPNNEPSTYSFMCESEEYLADFLQYTFCKFNCVNEFLYNYYNLPLDSNNITFELLQSDQNICEISGYDNSSLKRARLIKSLRILRNVFNYYN